jgi:tetratricopeptide (TPR) repeat protein
MKQALHYALLLTLACTSLAADRPPVDSGDVQMGEELGAMATRMLGRKNMSVSMWSESEALVQAAQKLNPREPRWARLAAHYAAKAGDTQGIVKADQDLLALEPEHRGAQTQLIDIYLAQMETADQKDSYLHSLISKQSLGNDVRSYAAMRLAATLMERSETAAAKAMIGQAINLNPLNLEALEAQYDIVQQSGSLMEKTIATLGLLRANPADPQMIWQLAHLLSQVGLEKESLNWYELALASMPRAGLPMPEELPVEYFTAVYLNGDAKAASQSIDKSLANDSNTPGIWMLKAVIERQESSPHLQDTIAKANVAAFNVIQNARHHMGATDATTRPVDLGEPVTFSDMSADLARISADTTGQLRRFYLTNVANWAWLQIYFAQKPDDAEPMLQFLAHITTPDDPILHRLRGWSALVKGDIDGAHAQFAAAPNDPLSEMGLIDIEKKQDAKDAASHARKLLSENSDGIIGAILYGDLKGKGVDLIPSNQSQAVLEQVNRFPAQLMTVLQSPQSFYSIRIDPVKVVYGYDEPMLVRIAIQNLTGIDLTIGNDALIHPLILIDAQQRGVGDQLFGGIAFDQFNSSILLHGGDEISQIVRIDQGDFGLMLLNNPESELQYTLLATTNPVPVKDQVYIGLGGFRVQMPRIIERAAASLSNQSGRDHVMQMLAGDDGAEKIRAIVLLGNYAAQYQTDPNAPASQKKAGTDLVHIIDQNSTTGSASVDAMAAFVMARLQTGEQRWTTLQKMAADTNWEKQLLAAIALSDAPIETQKKTDEMLAAGDHNDIVKKYAAARLITLAHPTTQP